MRRKRVVAVVGPGEAAPSLCAIARRVGLLLARNDVLVVTGGLGGVMAAAAAGVREADGFVLGLLPGHDRAAANDDLDLAIPTGLGQARNVLVVASADVVIAIGGNWGTLSEVALARRTETPVVWLHGWTLHDGDGAPVPFVTADSAEQAVELILADG